jgi:hypothetical protein
VFEVVLSRIHLSVGIIVGTRLFATFPVKRKAASASGGAIISSSCSFFYTSRSLLHNCTTMATTYVSCPSPSLPPLLFSSLLRTTMWKRKEGLFLRFCCMFIAVQHSYFDPSFHPSFLRQQSDKARAAAVGCSSSSESSRLLWPISAAMCAQMGKGREEEEDCCL